MANQDQTPSRDELVQQLADVRAELKFAKHAKTAEVITPIILSGIRWSAIVLCALFGYLSVATLAGKETNAVIDIKMLLDSNVLGIIFGGGGIVYGVVQWRLKRRVIARLQPRIQAFEQQIDPSRSSSLLTEHGETNPEDR